MDRIFDAFFTTKARGMGMGLSICRSIIEAHGGQLGRYPGTTHGTIFYITLPISGFDDQTASLQIEELSRAISQHPVLPPKGEQPSR